MSDSSQTHGLQPIRLLRPWDFPGKSIGVGFHCLLSYFANKGPYHQSYDFSSSYVWMWELDHKEDWALIELWCWRRLLKVPWTARRSNQSIIKGINPEYSLEGLILKLKFQYFSHMMRRPTHWKRTWFWERWKVGGEGNDRGWVGWTWVWASSRREWVWASSRREWRTAKPELGRSLEEGMATHSIILAWRLPMNRIAWWATVLGVTKSWTRLND